jgi:hypothetical protein
MMDLVSFCVEINCSIKIQTAIAIALICNNCVLLIVVGLQGILGVNGSTGLQGAESNSSNYLNHEYHSL